MRRRDDQGSMLVELMVGMTLMAIVGTLLLNAILSGFHTQRDLDARNQALFELRTTLERVTHDLREANPVRFAQTGTLSVRTLTSSGATVIQTWSVLPDADGTASLVQETQPTTSAGAPTGSVTRYVLIRGLDPTHSSFGYSAAAGFTAASRVDQYTCALAAAPGTFSKECIGAVTVQLLRTVKGLGPIPLTATVDLRNRT